MADFAAAKAFPLGGGLNLADAPESIPDGDAIELVNVRFPGAGRWAPRKSHTRRADIVGNLCGIHAMPHGSDTSNGSPNGVVYLAHTGGSVQLYAADGRGRNASLVGTLAGWNAVGSRPKTTAAVLAQCLWIVDESKDFGLTVYDPTDHFGTGLKLFQPSFKFEPGLSTPASPIMARTIGVYNNHLFIAGYGSEADPDRPEIVRFSYLGLEADTEGAGDAGKVDAPVKGDAGYDGASEHAPGSAGLFDIEDFFFVGPRGQPMMSFVSAGERMLMLTRFSAHILYGYDRFSFQADLLDNQRGCVATRAAGEANGMAWWWSPLGPTAWGGGDLEPLERPITPIHLSLNFDTLFFAHQPKEYEVRWYHSPDNGDPWKAVDYSYLYNRWKQREVGTRVFCAGLTKPGTVLEPGPGGDPLPPDDNTDPDMVPPSNTQAIDITPGSATVIWDNGETGASIETLVELRETGGTFKPESTVNSGVTTVTVASLRAGTSYDVRVFHRDTETGLESADDTATFTTLGEGAINKPKNLNVDVRQNTDNIEGVTVPSEDVTVHVTWDLGQFDVYTSVQARRVGITDGEVRTHNKGENVTQDKWIEFQLDDGEWEFRARHSDCFAFHEQLNPCGEASNWTNWLSVDMADPVRT